MSSAGLPVETPCLSLAPGSRGIVGRDAFTGADAWLLVLNTMIRNAAFKKPISDRITGTTHRESPRFEYDGVYLSDP